MSRRPLMEHPVQPRERPKAAKAAMECGSPAERKAGKTTVQQPAGASAVEGQAAEPLAQRLTAGLVKLSLALRHQAWRGAQPEGLTPTQGQILSTLLLSRPHGATPGELAKALAVTAATVSDAVDALEAKGLLRRLAHPHDRRSVLLTLTELGRQAARAAAGWADFLAASIERLPQEDQLALLRVLVRLVRDLQLGGHIPVARMCVCCRYFRPYAHAGSSQPHHCDFVDAPFGEAALRLDCPDHEPASPQLAQALWVAWASHRA